MSKKQYFQKFLSKDDGAVTVDFVVLTGAIVGLGLAVLLQVSGGATALADTTSAEISALAEDSETPAETSDQSGTSTDETRERHRHLQD